MRAGDPGVVAADESRSEAGCDWYSSASTDHQSVYDGPIPIPIVNSRLSQLQPYPFEKLRALLAGLTPAGRPIPLSIGEPQHATPEIVRRAIADHLDGLSSYPATAGHEGVRAAIASWFERRYNLKSLDPRTQVLPVNGTREALFAFGQAVIDPVACRPRRRVAESVLPDL